MITRRHVRRVLAWLGLGVGVTGLVGYILSFTGTVTRPWSTDRCLEFGRGAFTVYWARSGLMGAATSYQVDVREHWKWVPANRTLPDFNTFVIHGEFVLPYWIPVLVGAVSGYCLLPAGYPRGRCRKCGYDLGGVPSNHGTVTCPECGTKGS